MNGCCYGDPCDLPWAITFPKESVPFLAQVDRGMILPDAPASLALHPTQIYSALNAAVLWAVTATYYRFRPKDGAVLAVGWLLYPLARFTIEILRGDEMYQFTDVVSLTISQWGSVVLFLTGLVFVAFLRTRPMLEAKVLEAETD